MIKLLKDFYRSVAFLSSPAWATNVLLVEFSMFVAIFGLIMYDLSTHSLGWGFFIAVCHYVAYFIVSQVFVTGIFHLFSKSVVLRPGLSGFIGYAWDFSRSYFANAHLTTDLDKVREILIESRKNEKLLNHNPVYLGYLMSLVLERSDDKRVESLVAVVYASVNDDILSDLVQGVFFTPVGAMKLASWYEEYNELLKSGVAKREFNGPGRIFANCGDFFNKVIAQRDRQTWKL